jgi:hypothetical protein
MLAGAVYRKRKTCTGLLPKWLVSSPCTPDLCNKALGVGVHSQEKHAWHHHAEMAFQEFCLGFGFGLLPVMMADTSSRPDETCKGKSEGYDQVTTT